jgi:hypothetical protein
MTAKIEPQNGTQGNSQTHLKAIAVSVKIPIKKRAKDMAGFKIAPY